MREDTDGRTDGQTNGPYQVHYLPHFAVDNYIAGNLDGWGVAGF